MEKKHAELKGIIRQARMNAGLTQEQLAEAIFVSRDKISAFENGRSEPGYTEIVLLSKALRIPVSDFFRKQVRQRMIQTRRIRPGRFSRSAVS